MQFGQCVRVAGGVPQFTQGGRVPVGRGVHWMPGSQVAHGVHVAGGVQFGQGKGVLEGGGVHVLHGVRVAGGVTQFGQGRGVLVGGGVQVSQGVRVAGGVHCKHGGGVPHGGGGWLGNMHKPRYRLPGMLHSYWVNRLPVPFCTPTVALLPPWSTCP